MPKLSVADLDALAAEHDVADYPADGLKADKEAALEAAGVELAAAKAPPTYSFRVSDDVEGGVASFMADHEAVELSPDNPTFTTSDARIAADLRELSFLEEE